MAAVDLANNADTIDNIRLWDWRALQDTLRQIQEIRTYYDFPDIDIDRYVVGGRMRQMMVAARELNVEKLPESSRNFINEKLIYTHGYGVTMNPVNGFTAEGLPRARAERHAGAKHAPGDEGHAARDLLRRADQHRRLRADRQKEFNYPQGESNSYTAYEGKGGIPIGSFGRRLLLRREPRRRGPVEAAVQRRHPARQPAADAAQHPRTGADARARSSASTPTPTSW